MAASPEDGYNENLPPIFNQIRNHVSGGNQNHVSIPAPSRPFLPTNEDRLNTRRFSNTNNQLQQKETAFHTNKMAPTTLAPQHPSAPSIPPPPSSGAPPGGSNPVNNHNSTPPVLMQPPPAVQPPPPVLNRPPPPVHHQKPPPPPPNGSLTPVGHPGSVSQDGLGIVGKTENKWDMDEKEAIKRRIYELKRTFHNGRQLIVRHLPKDTTEQVRRP